MINTPKYKKWLILSHAFNMDGRAASQTVTDKVPYLLAEGIELNVLSAVTGSKDSRFFHQQIIAWGPAALRFDFRHWFANRFGRGLAYKIITPLVSIILSPLILFEKFIFGYSSQWSWAFSAYFVGMRLINAGKVDLIYSSGGAWSAHLAGLWLKKKTKLPWISEVHDPLVMRKSETDLGVEIPKESDSKRRYLLEQEICNHADIAWWFTEGALYYAKKRNPKLNTPNHAKGLMIIPGANPPTPIQNGMNQEYQHGNKLKISHFGSLADNRSLKQILNVLPDFFKSYPEAKTQIEFHIYGAKLDNESKKTARLKNLNSIIIEHGRLESDSNGGLSGREKIAQLMKKTDILLLLHGEGAWCAEYIPSKLYDYIWFDRPIWAIINNNKQLENLILAREGFVSDTHTAESIYASLEKFWLIWKAGKLNKTVLKTISPQTSVNMILEEVNNLSVNSL